MNLNKFDAIGLIKKLKVKDNVLNIVIIVLALNVASNIFKTKQAALVALKSNLNTENQKNTVLRDIAVLEQNANSLKKTVDAKSSSTPLEALNNFLEQAAIKEASSRALSETDSLAYVRYPFELTIAADSYRQIGKFISLLEKSPDIFVVDSITINSNSFGSGNNKITARLIVSTIVIKN
jgi:hypothetical protein